MVRVTRKILHIMTRAQRRFIIILAFMMLIGGLAESLSVSLIIPLITAIMNTDTWRDTWYAGFICKSFYITNHIQYISLLIIVIICIFVLKNVYLLFEIRTQLRFISKSRYNMQKELMKHYLAMPYEFYLHAQSGEIVRIIGEDSAQSFVLLTNILYFYTDLFVSIMLGVTIFIISPLLAIEISIILLLELMFISKLIKPRMQKEGEISRFNGALALKWILQSIQGIKSIKVAKKEEYFSDTYNHYAEKVVDAQCNNGILANIPKLVIESVTISAVMLLILFMALTGRNVVEIVPQLSGFVVAAMKLLPSINRISSSINQVPFSEGALDNIIKVIESENIYHDGLEDIEQKSRKGSPDSVRMDSFHSLKLQNVSFSYNRGNDLILKNIDMIVLSGQSVGIIGPSGAGKTTTIDIILGLLRPQNGEILINGIRMDNVLSSWRDNIAYIPQNIFLIDDTIRNNVVFGKFTDDEEDEKVWNALREAQMEEFIKSLPEGLDTVVGEQGIRLSGGQKQRIGIARALYPDPFVLFFDEATSALDNDTESAIMESINHLKGQKTLIIIAHRLSTIENCDVIYKVENGHISKER